MKAVSSALVEDLPRLGQFRNVVPLSVFGYEAVEQEFEYPSGSRVASESRVEMNRCALERDDQLVSPAFGSGPGTTHDGKHEAEPEADGLQAVASQSEGAKEGGRDLQSAAVRPERSTGLGAGRPRQRPLVRVAFAVLAVIGAGLSPVEAQPEDGRSREQVLVEIQAQVSELRDQLAEVDTVGTNVEAQLARLDLELRLQQQLVAEAGAERTLAEKLLEETEVRHAAIAQSLTATRARLRQRILDLYRAAPADWLRGFASVRQPSDFFLYVRTLRFLAQRDARLLPAFRREQLELESEWLILVEREQEVAESVIRERARLEGLRTARRRQVLVARALARERARIEREADALDDKEQKLSLLIAVLANEDERSSSDQPIQDFRGALDWPVAGEVSVPFGPRYEARYGTSVPHNGVEISPSADGRVSAVFPGIVIFAADFEGFGLTVVLHHRDDVFSLYAGLEELEVAKGDVVVLDRVLGRTGSDLYFEMRVDNRPEDPLEWLR